MNGVTTSTIATGLPATTVLRLTAEPPIRPTQQTQADEVLLAAVTHPPRIGEVRPIAALIPDVLARYGLPMANESRAGQGKALDLLA